MSYILDALKKADSERHIGTAPNIYAQPVIAAASHNKFSFWNTASIAVMAVLLASIFGVFFLLRQEQKSTEKSTEIAAPAVITPAITPAALPATSGNANDFAPPPALAAAAPAVNVPAQKKNTASAKENTAEAVKLKSDAKLALPAAKGKISEPPVAAADVAMSKSNTKVATQPPSNTTELSLRDLPPKIQAEIPELVVGGSIYSANRGESQLLINKKLLREGEEIAPGLTLEKMMPHAAILLYKGYRYRIAY